MTISRATQQVQYSTANSVSVSAGGNSGASDAITLNAATGKAYITCKADNAGTPASGDTIDVYLSQSTGDTDTEADTVTDYPLGTTAMEYLGTLDTNVTDPFIKTFEIPVVALTKVWAYSNASSNSITFSAQIEEVRG